MTPEEIAALQKSLEDSKKVSDDLKKEIEALKAAKPEPKQDEKDLGDKVREENDKKDAHKAESKKLERALQFDMSKAKFIDENKSILPSSLLGIFDAADKETYESIVEKANATKASVIKEFFSVEANLNGLLTPTHKTVVEDYLKLTSNARSEKAEEIYENIFEPAFLSHKLIKKQEEVNRAKNGHSNSTDAEKMYLERLKKGSEKHYLGVRD